MVVCSQYFIGYDLFGGHTKLAFFVDAENENEPVLVTQDA
jgi:hypothetical protein